MDVDTVNRWHRYMYQTRKTGNWQEKANMKQQNCPFKKYSWFKEYFRTLRFKRMWKKFQDAQLWHWNTSTRRKLHAFERFTCILKHFFSNQTIEWIFWTKVKKFHSFGNSKYVIFLSIMICFLYFCSADNILILF